MKQLNRSSENKIILGVCSGFAEYFDLDPTIVRIIWAFTSIISFFIGIFAYIICYFIIPSDTKTNTNKKVNFESTNYSIKQKKTTKLPIKSAYALISIGFILLINNYISINLLNPKFLFPILLIIIGFSFLIKDCDTYEK